MRNSRFTLALNGIVMMFLGLAFWFRPEFFTLAMFPDVKGNLQAIELGNALRKNMGAGCLFIGLLLFWCQNSSKTIAQRLLLGSASSNFFPNTICLHVYLLNFRGNTAISRINSLKKKQRHSTCSYIQFGCS